MAILQISRITNRKGLTENLPQLAGAEFGWCTNDRRLFIGNGTIGNPPDGDGAPTVGNTEILTEFSDVVAASKYTYKDITVGYAPQTGVSVSEPAVRTVQERLDDIATVRGFGATGDGLTDDTDAINRALFELFCIQSNTQVRRSLLFPAGTYRISQTLNIPSYAKLIGEGADSTVFLLDIDSDTDYVARYADSAGQTGANIGNNGAVPPRNIEISSISFVTEKATDVFLIENATQCYFDSCNFQGPLSNVVSEPEDEISGIRFSSGISNVCNQITLDKCAFIGLKYGINDTLGQVSQQTQSVTASNSRFFDLYQGIVLGAGSSIAAGGTTGFRAVHNMFDQIYAQGIRYSGVSLNISAYNVFYNVGNAINSGPETPVVSFGNSNNVSLSDMFERNDIDARTQPRISVIGSSELSTTQIQLGNYTRQAGKTVVLSTNQVDQIVFAINPVQVKAFSVNYVIVQGSSIRNGTLTVTASPNLSAVFTDDYTENQPTAVVLSADQISSSVLYVRYSNPSLSSTATLSYSIQNLI